MPAPQSHFVFPVDLSSISCEQLAEEIARIQARLQWTEGAIKAADARREAADKTAAQWQDLEHEASKAVKGDLAGKPVDQTGPGFAKWQEKLQVDEAAVSQAHAEGEKARQEGQDALRERQQLHEEQEWLRRLLEQARQQRAARCVCETGTSTGAQLAGFGIKKVAASVGALVAGAAAVGLLMIPAKAQSTPTPAPKMYAKDVTPKPKMTAKDVTPKPKMTAKDVTPKPKMTAKDVTPKPKMTAKDVTPKPKMTAKDVTPKPAPQQESRDGSTSSSSSVRSESCTSSGSGTTCTTNTGANSESGRSESDSRTEEPDTYVDPREESSSSPQETDSPQTIDTSEETRDREPVG